ncbi:LysR family transcriptional regulator [Geotalea uraniireducens]|uniref:LysR family transcriptional regulator n=1 Tax=Geotalea uraniireducens TaxID=351604 RepID=A0ABM8EGD0_9BACT|nr:LysR substrate-binding domain-containing protein [Geotalea uraniireducens]BDV41466.1 LysR family transcriptional regulator [Geotalea uraniireducens]
MAITLRQLEVFEKLASCGHATRAGESLLLSQAAVSMAIAELERLTGGPLFERRGRRLVLNERGRMLLPEARQVLQRVATVEKILLESAEEPAGVLQVGASTTIGNYLLPSLMGHFAERYPRARVLLQVGNTHQVEKAVEEGALDLGLIEGSCQSRELEQIPWRGDELVVVAGPSHPWSGERRADLALLAGASWIVREKGSGTREVFEQAMLECGIDWSVALELGHTEAIKRGVEAGLGVSCLSRLAVARELDHGWLVEVVTPLALRRTLMLLHRPSRYRTPLFSAFLAMLAAAGDRRKDEPA